MKLIDTVMQIEKALTNDRLRVSNVSWNFHISTIVFAVYKQNFTTQ